MFKGISHITTLLKTLSILNFHNQNEPTTTIRREMQFPAVCFIFSLPFSSSSRCAGLLKHHLPACDHSVFPIRNSALLTYTAISRINVCMSLMRPLPPFLTTRNCIRVSPRKWSLLKSVIYSPLRYHQN